MPVAHHKKSASRWRIHISQIDRMEIGSLLARSSSRRISLDRTGFSAMDFRFFRRKVAENAENT